ELQTNRKRAGTARIGTRRQQRLRRRTQAQSIRRLPECCLLQHPSQNASVSVALGAASYLLCCNRTDRTHQQRQRTERARECMCTSTATAACYYCCCYYRSATGRRVPACYDGSV
uniref:Uncharacterized protein n=1 Tax=Anopheles dirus TaxID=7168 RepID=A0A182NYX6_9DIPT